MSRSQNIHHLAHFEGAFALLLFIIDNDPTLVILKIFVDTDLIIVLVEVKLLLEGLLDGIHGRASQRLLLVLVREHGVVVEDSLDYRPVADHVVAYGLPTGVIELFELGDLRVAILARGLEVQLHS